MVTGIISLKKQGEQRITEKIVLAYSGGLDTSVMITWLKQNYKNAEVITATIDVGQNEDLDAIKWFNSKDLEPVWSTSEECKELAKSLGKDKEKYIPRGTPGVVFMEKVKE